MKNRKRICALLLCIGLALVFSVSSAYIAHEAGHDCCGHDCPVCQVIAACVNLLRTAGLAGLVMLALACLMEGEFAGWTIRAISVPSQGTPVAWKVRLNN